MCRVVLYVVPVVLLSVGLNLTKFFETEYYTLDAEEEVGKSAANNISTGSNNR